MAGYDGLALVFLTQFFVEDYCWQFIYNLKAKGSVVGRFCQKRLIGLHVVTMIVRRSQ